MRYLATSGGLDVTGAIFETVVGQVWDVVKVFVIVKIMGRKMDV